MCSIRQAIGSADATMLIVEVRRCIHGSEQLVSTGIQPAVIKTPATPSCTCTQP